MPNEAILITIHSTNPCNKGFHPTYDIACFDNPAPIKNNDSVNPASDINVNSSDIDAIPGTKVRIIDAKTNKSINYGISILLLLF